MTKLITIVVMFSCAAALIVWDVIANANKVPGDTISEVSLSFFRRYPIAGMGLALAAGIIIGHLTWPQYLATP